MRAVFGVLALMLVAAPAQAQLGHFMGGVADQRAGTRYTDRDLEQLRRDDERRQRQMQLNRLERQNEEMRRIIQEQESRRLMQRYGTHR